MKKVLQFMALSLPFILLACNSGHNKVNDTQNPIAYMANNTSQISFCNESGESFTSCSLTGTSALGSGTPESAPFSNSSDVAINQQGTMAYVVSFNNGGYPGAPGGYVSSCKIESSKGKLVLCQRTPPGTFATQVNLPDESGTFENPSTIALTHNGKYAYVAAGYISHVNSVFVCGITESGILGSCNRTGDGFVAPTGITTGYSDRSTYVLNSNLTISGCLIESSGNLGSCQHVVDKSLFGGESAVEYNSLAGITLESSRNKVYFGFNLLAQSENVTHFSKWKMSPLLH